jgi:YggT family protein
VGALGSLLSLLLTIYLLVLIVRMVLDWIGVTGNPPEWARKGRYYAYRATEPVIAPVRRVVKPIRLGSVSFDLAFTIVFIVVLVLRGLVTRL